MRDVSIVFRDFPVLRSIWRALAFLKRSLNALWFKISRGSISYSRRDDGDFLREGGDDRFVKLLLIDGFARVMEALFLLCAGYEIYALRRFLSGF